MSYKWFVLIFLASVVATVVLAFWKVFAADYTYSSLGIAEKTFIGKVSWFAVPWPLFIAIAVLGGPYIVAVLLADQ